MKKYIALLRGVNVGGNNKISMRELKAAFEKTGFTGVQTYINSGNVIFSSDSGSAAELQEKCERLIAGNFNMKIMVAVISAESLNEALRNAPDWWDNDSGSKHNALFVIYPASAEDVIKGAGAIKPEYEKAGYFGQVIFWSAPLETFSHTRWSKIVSSKAYGSVTIRNANTAKKILQLATGE